MNHQRKIIALAAILCGAAPGARAEEGAFMKKALSSIGLVEPDRAPITYRERAPLVLPPKTGAAALPPPVARSAVRDEAPSWPTDPEAKARARRSAEEAKPRGMHGEGGRMSDNNMTLPVQEMRAGRRDGSGATPSEPVYKPGDNVREATWVNPFDLFKGKKDDTANLPDVEPDREALTEPPTGYRAPPNGKLVRAPSGPKGMISDREEADPGVYLRSRQQ
jgi:hypothetical protein